MEDLVIDSLSQAHVSWIDGSVEGIGEEILWNSRF